ncbi:MAG: YkgJ family cysteine cluster protein [Pseudomonadota bacterium]
MYKRLLQKIDQHIEKVRRQNSGDFVCKPGCADCCVGGISVWRIEHENIREYLKLSAASFQPSAKKDKCPFLNNEDLCSIYPARPIVCRLWGAPILFGPQEDPLPNVDEISNRITSDKGVLTCCNKNFTKDSSLKKIKAEYIINLDLVLSTLAAINHVYCKELGFDPTERFKLSR